MCLSSLGGDDLNCHDSQIIIRRFMDKKGFPPSKEDFVCLFHILFVKRKMVIYKRCKTKALDR